MRMKIKYRYLDWYELEDKDYQVFFVMYNLIDIIRRGIYNYKKDYGFNRRYLICG